MRRFWIIVGRDINLGLRQGSPGSHAVVFYVLVILLFPLAIGPETELLERIAGGVIWVAALLSTILSLDRMFQSDFEDGSLDLLALSGDSLAAVVSAKCFAHWCSTGVPLIIASPILGLLLSLNIDGYFTLLLAMALGTPTLSLIGAVGAALTVGIRRGGIILPLLVLPLYVPVLVFGVGAVEHGVRGLDPGPHLMVLGALLLVALVTAPIGAGAAVRANLQ